MRTEEIQQSLLIVAFLVLTATVLIAYLNPATSYELSIYDGTPISVWIGICFSLFIALVFSFNTSGSTQKLSLFLAGNSFLVIVMLPLIRGYYHLGEGDTMSHIGIAKDLLTGVIAPTDVGYPAVHLIALFTKEILAIPITQSFYYTTYTFIVLFIVFIPLSTRLITNDPLFLSLSTFSALLLLPVNLISVHMNVHPTSQAILFTSLLIYIFSSYVKNSDDRHIFILPVVSLAALMIHPQQAANFLLFLFVTSIVQALHIVMKKKGEREIRTVAIQSCIFSIMFWIWFASSGFVEAFRRFLVSLLTFGGDVAGEVGQRSGSLAELGSGPVELLIKLFSVSIVFCLIAGGYMILVLVSRFLRDEETDNDIVVYLTFGFFPISSIFFIYIIANVTTQYFRHLGFMMVVITIIGCLGLGHFTQEFFSTEKNARTALTVVFILFVSLSLLIVYPSPYIYQETEHVPKAQVNGYETAFDHYNEGTEFLFLRSATERYIDFHSVNSQRRPDVAPAPYHFAEQDLASSYSESKYLVVTVNDRKLESEVYNGFRFSEEDFQYLETDPTISRVQSTGAFKLYLVTNNQSDRETNNRTSEIEAS